MHNFLVCAYKSQDFAQNLKIFARSHDCMTVTFRNFVIREPVYGGPQVRHLLETLSVQVFSIKGNSGSFCRQTLI